MTDKERYTNLMQRYWNAETTPEEEQELAWYAAMTNDPDFETVRGVLGYLSIGRMIRKRTIVRRFRQRAAGIAAAVVAVVIGGTLLFARIITNDRFDALTSMESTLTDIFSSGTDIESELTEILNQ